MNVSVIGGSSFFIVVYLGVEQVDQLVGVSGVVTVTHRIEAAALDGVAADVAEAVGRTAAELDAVRRVVSHE
jgi:hypothetical protein